jgi:predicted  nucleic acid-binding Zn-ribbon protein
MTNEELEKRKEFILEQRARFAAGMQQLREAQALTERVVAETEETVIRFENKMREGSKELNSKFNALADSQERTTQDLRNLIAKLDPFFTERRNRN